jgi:hypothetical protein
MSCNKHQHLWQSITSKNIQDLIIFTGGSDKTYYDESNKILHLKCNDLYEGLPEKMILLIEYILHSNHFSDVTHILKIDDHDNIFSNENIIDVRNLPEINEYHYIGQRLVNKNAYPWSWSHSNKYHFGKVSDKSVWFNKSYKGGFVPWLDGGWSYILSLDAMKCIWSWYNSSNLDELRKTEIFEDVMMAKILYHHGIFPKEINYGIKGDK